MYKSHAMKCDSLAMCRVPGTTFAALLAKYECFEEYKSS